MRFRKRKSSIYCIKHYATLLFGKVVFLYSKFNNQSIIAKAAGDTELEQKARMKINLLTDKYHKLSEVSGLPTRMERIRGTVNKKNVHNFVDKSSKSDIIEVKEVKSVKSGAFYGALNPESDKDFERCEQHAIRYYNEIRNRSSDVEVVAKNTGFDVEKVNIVKNHIFLNKYDLGEDEPTTFYPNYDIAVSWQNLISGKNIETKDIILIEHEYYEYKLMSEKGMSYIEAHEMAQKKYNYQKAVKDWRKQK